MKSRSLSFMPLLLIFTLFAFLVSCGDGGNSNRQASQGLIGIWTATLPESGRKLSIDFRSQTSTTLRGVWKVDTMQDWSTRSEVYGRIFEDGSIRLELAAGNSYCCSFIFGVTICDYTYAYYLDFHGEKISYNQIHDSNADLSISCESYTEDMYLNRFIPLAVRSSYPAEGEVGFPTDNVIEVKFNNDIDHSTVDSTTLYLLDSMDNIMSGNYGGHLSTVLFRPSHVLNDYSPYKLVVTTGIMDEEGDTLDEDHAIHFISGSVSDTTLP